MSINFQNIFDSYVRHDEKVWGHDRGKTLGASSTFACLRKSFFEKFGKDRGFDPDPDYEESWGTMKRGDVMEDHWVVPALMHGLPPECEYIFAGSDQETFVYGLNSATPDGLVINAPKNALEEYGIADIESDCFNVEIKSIDPRVNLDEEKAIHHGQAQIQMGILRRMTEYKPMYTVILYVDASFYDDISVFVVRYEPGKWKLGQKRAKMLFDAVGPSELKPEGKLTGECKLCKFRHACSTVNGEGIPTNDKMDDETSTALVEKLDALATNREQLKAEIGDLEKELEEHNSMIKESLSEIGSRKAVTPSFRFGWSFQKGRETIDKDALIEDGIDIDKYKKRGAGFDKLTVTRLK